LLSDDVTRDVLHCTKQAQILLTLGNNILLQSFKLIDLKQCIMFRLIK